LIESLLGVIVINNEKERLLWMYIDFESAIVHSLVRRYFLSFL